MKDRSTLRKLMIAAGLLAALIIVVSPAFQQETTRAMQEVKTDEKEAEQGPKISAVSTEAITSPQAVQVEQANPFVIQEIITECDHPSPFTIPVTLSVTALTTLLRSVISPQAP